MLNTLRNVGTIPILSLMYRIINKKGRSQIPIFALYTNRCVLIMTITYFCYPQPHKGGQKQVMVNFKYD